MSYECPFCGEEGYTIDRFSGECSNEKCGGFFTLQPSWELNKEWSDDK